MYATRQDLGRLALPPAAIEGMYDDDAELDAAVTECLTSASGVIDGYLAARFVLPLVSWSDDLRRHCSIIAAYDLMSVRGHNPHGPDENLRLRYQDTLRWLRDVADGKIHPIVEDSSEIDPAVGGGPLVASKPPRGW